MGIYRGPGVVNEGLVFGYDTGYPISDNTTNNRFNQGQPATNLFTVLGSPSNVDENVTFSVNGTGTFKRVAVGTEIGDYKVNNVDVVYSYALGVNGCHYHGNDYSSVTSGTKVSLSVEYFLSQDVGSFDTNYLGNFEQLSGVSGSWGTVSSTKGVWHKVTLTRTATATGNLRMLMYPGGCSSSRLSATGTIYYKNPTVTLTEQPVPFVDGTRSDTASLIDLKRTTSIDVGDVSFDSNAQPTFDGTDDFLTVPSYSGFTVDTRTVEIIFKMNGSYSNFSPLAVYANGSSSSNRIWLGLQNSQFQMHGWGTVDPSGSTTIAADTWYVCTFSYNKSTQAMKVYTNGVLESSVTNTQGGVTAVSGMNWYLATVPGGWQSVTYSDVDIPSFKIYDRILSDAEVAQNFNAYKNRFNI